jgi:hypothetical protein
MTAHVLCSEFFIENLLEHRILNEITCLLIDALETWCQDFHMHGSDHEVYTRLDIYVLVKIVTLVQAKHLQIDSSLLSYSSR